MSKAHRFLLMFILMFLLVITFSVITAHAADYYAAYNSQDATSNIQSAIQSAVGNPGADRVILSYQGAGTKWISGPLQLYSDMEFVLENGVVLEAKSGAFASGTPLILISGASNVKITGANATIRMPINEYTDGEWRHCVSVRSSSSIEITGVTLEKSGGDGIYLGSNGTANNNILIQNVVCDGNARNGISVISAENLTITGCTLKNTGQYNPAGLASGGPWAGIDFEPNYATEKLSNITMTDCVFDNNKNYGIDFYLYNVGPTSSQVSIDISGCTVKGSYHGITSSRARSGAAGTVSIENCTVEGSGQSAIVVNEWAYDSIALNINNCTIESAGYTSSSNGTIHISGSSSYTTGNIIIDNINMFKCRPVYAVRLAGGTSDYKIKGVTGSVYTDQADASILYNSFYEDISLSLYRLNADFINVFSSDADDIGGTDREAFFTNPAAIIYPGDYNGDGKTDLFVKGVETYRALYLANSTGTGFARVFMGNADGVGGTDSEAFFTDASAVIYPGDYNGDGKTDMFVKGYGTWRALYLANSAGNGFNCAFQGDADSVGGTDSEGFFTGAGVKLYTGDYNGDGKTDLFVKGNGAYRAMYLANSTGTGFGRVFLGDADGVGGTDSEPFFTDASAIIYPGDYNGDGRTDMFVKGYGTWRALYLANSTGNGFDCAFQSDADNVGGTDSEGFFTGAGVKLYTGDYNGDGKTDMFVKGNGTYRALYLANSTGTGFGRVFLGDADGAGGTDSEAFFTDASAVIYPGDYNGDGKTDMFVKGYGTWRALYIANSAGQSFTCAFQGDADGVGGTDSDAFFTDPAAKVYTGDYDGDGKTDLFIKGYGAWRALYTAGGDYELAD